MKSSDWFPNAKAEGFLAFAPTVSWRCPGGGGGGGRSSSIYWCPVDFPQECQEPQPPSLILGGGGGGSQPCICVVPGELRSVGPVWESSLVLHSFREGFSSRSSLFHPYECYPRLLPKPRSLASHEPWRTLSGPAPAFLCMCCFC